MQETAKLLGWKLSEKVCNGLWLVPSLGHKIMYTVLYLCLSFRFPDLFLPRINIVMVTTNLMGKLNLNKA